MNIIIQELKKEFSLKSFGFSFPKAEAFFTSQWKWPPFIFVVYRVIVAFFTIGSLSAFVSKNSELPHHVMAYLTSWSYVLLTLHFNWSAAVVLYRFCRTYCFSSERDREDHAALKSVSSSSCSPSHSTDHEMDTCNETCHTGDAMNNCILAAGHPNTDGCSESSMDNTIESSSPMKLNIPNVGGGGLAGSNGCTLPGDHHYMTINGSSSSPAISKKILIKGSDYVEREDQTRWYIKVSWLLYETISSVSVIVTVVYFVAIYPYLNGTDSFEDISVHGINTVLVAFEMIIAAYPVRLLHTLYTAIFGVLYVIFSLIYWSQAPQINVIYFKMLDWNQPKGAIILVCILLFVVAPFLQSAFFLIYKCRLRLYRIIYRESYLT